MEAKIRDVKHFIIAIMSVNICTKFLISSLLLFCLCYSEKRTIMQTEADP